MAKCGTKINRKKDQNQKARSVQRGVSAHYLHLEKFMYAWFLNQHKVGFSISTLELITKAVRIETNYKDEPLVFHYSIPKLTALLLLHGQPHECDLPYRPSLSQWVLGLGEILYFSASLIHITWRKLLWFVRYVELS